MPKIKSDPQPETLSTDISGTDPVSASFSLAPAGRILLTRPGEKNRLLASELASLGIPSLCCPLLEIVPTEAPDVVAQLGSLAPQDIVIAVSENAATLASQALNSGWPPDLEYYAVGQATARAMKAAGLNSVMLPDDPRTEGLLLMSGLQSLANRRVLILRGEGGRETLAQQLMARGAQVAYCELYRRQAIKYDRHTLLQQWQQQGVKTIVVTSGEILLNLLTLIPESEKSWLRQCHLIVPSPRVAELARGSGWGDVIQSNGAASTAIIDSIKTLQSEGHGQ